MIYQPLKVIHIISMLVWSSGMFRLFDYYQNASGREAERDGVLSFDCRWTTPAMLSTWLAGASMAYLAGWWNHRWFLWKVLLVVVLSGLHGVLVGRLGRESRGILPQLQTCWLVPPILAVVALVVFKP